MKTCIIVKILLCIIIIFIILTIKIICKFFNPILHTVWLDNQSLNLKSITANIMVQTQVIYISS
jgi:hypothetical protein